MELVETTAPLNEMVIKFKVKLATGKLIELKVSSDEMVTLTAEEMEELAECLNYKK